MLERAGVDYLHVSAGTGFPHPRNPAGRFPAKDVVKTYDVLISSGRYALRNFVVFRTWPLSAGFRWWWEGPHRKLGIEGINLPGSKAVKDAVSIPVLCTGGFQTASVISAAIERGDCDGVTIARPLVANPDLVRLLRAGPRPGAAAVHVLQQVPVRLRREPARLLRRATLRLPRADDRRDPLRLRGRPAMTNNAAIFEPLRFPTFEVKNRVFRSSLAGRFNNYDGTGTQIHMNWDLKFARGGVGAIISSNAPVHPRGLIVPNYAHIDRDETVPFWRELVRRVHEHDCKYIVQLAFSGRQRDLGGIQFEKGWSSTDKPEPIHGLECERMTKAQIDELVALLRPGRAPRPRGGRRRHRGARLQRLPDHPVPLVRDQRPQRTSTAARSRTAPASRSRSCARSAPRSGDDYHLQFKITAVDYGDDLFPWAKKGTTLEESIQVCKWLEEAGVDAFHVSSGNSFPHPRNPAGGFPVEDVVRGYDTMISSGRHTFRNYLIFRTWPVNQRLQAGPGSGPSQGAASRASTSPTARAIKEAVSGAGGLHGRLPDRVRRGGRDRARRLRRRHDRPPADREPEPRPALASGHDRPPKPVHLLEQVPDQPAREPARLLRREPLRVARGDGRARSSPSTSRPQFAASPERRDLHAARGSGTSRCRTGSSARASRAGSTTTTARARRRGSTGKCRFARCGRRRDHLRLVRRRPPRLHRPRLRLDRQRRPHPVLARARPSGCTSTGASTSSSSRTAAGSATSAASSSPRVSARPASRIRCTASRPSGRRPRSCARSRARSPRRPNGHARRASTASRSTARTATCSRSSSRRRSTTATTSTAARSRIARACCSRRCARSGSRSATTSTCR